MKFELLIPNSETYSIKKEEARNGKTIMVACEYLDSTSPA
jgi:hypothetical protein